MGRLISIIGLSFSVILFSLSLKYNFLGERITIDPLMRSSLLFIVSLLFSDSISRIVSRDNLKKHHDKIVKLLKGQVEFKIVGNSDSALRYIISRLPEIKYVRNTEMKTSPDVQSTVYNPDLYKVYISNLKKEIDKGLLNWTDLVNHNNHGKKEELVSWASEKQRRKYSAIITPNDIPIVNHIILRYKNGNREVLFGWAYSKDRPMGEVFSSNNSQIIEFFEHYFDDLSKLQQTKAN